MLRNLFSNTVYIKVHPNRLELRDVENGKSTVLLPTQAFTTKRLLVGEFDVADELLKAGMKQLNGDKLFAAAPLVVIQPMSMIEGGLSQVEERVLLELAASSGARKSKVWIGHELSDTEVIKYANSV